MSGSPGEKDYFVHETACVDEGAKIGKGSHIWHFAHVRSTAVIGENCNIGQNVYIGGDVEIGNNVKIQNNVSVYERVRLEDDVFCGPSMVFTNVMNPRSHVPRKDEFMTTVVRRGATLGANCTIVCGNELGRYAFVGAGSVVTKDVPSYALLYGVPAKLEGWMCACGIQLAFEGEGAQCTACGMRYRKQDLVVSPADEEGAIE